MKAEELRPANQIEAMLGYPAWRSFVSWAFDQPEMRQQYTAETGRPWPAKPRNGLDAMIDQATGHAEHHAEDFMLWVTAAHWGDEMIPEAVRALLARAEREGEGGAEAEQG